MGQIILLAFGAAVFPTLLACVAILISRPSPRPLLLAFYAGAMITSITAGVIVLAIFNNGNDALGSTTSDPHPGFSIVAGVAALALAWLMASPRGKARLDALREKRAARKPPKEQQGPSWAERHLNDASAKVAFIVGAAINLPGPFYLLALGDISTGGYSTLQQAGLIVLFNAIMFLLLEVPLVGYLISPDATAERVSALSRWLNANGLRVMGALVGIVGVSLLVQGIAAL
jgi:Sap, sulfolipid-1-addressing protein